MLNSRQPPWPRIAQGWVRRSHQQTQLTQQHIAHRLGVMYGDKPGQTVDIYWPNELRQVNLPVVAFIHGGYFTNGSPGLAGHLANWVTKLPAILVCVGYRLAPRATLFEQISDCAQAIAWVSRRISDVGGDGNRIALLGHSAGGHLASMLGLQSCHLEQLGCAQSVLRTCMPISGVFDLTQAVPRVARFVIKKPSDAIHYTPFYQINDSCRIPFVVAVAEHDFTEMRRDSDAMVRALKRANKPVTSINFPGQNHFSETFALAQQQDWIGLLQDYLTEQ